MSKSLGNFTLVKDIRKKIDPMVLRLFMLSVHYRTPINYSEETIELAKTNFNKIKTSYLNLKFRLKNNMEEEKISKEIENQLKENIKNLTEEMDDDFNSANALSSWYELVKIANLYIEKEKVNKETLEMIKAVFETYQEILGINLEEETIETNNQISEEEIETLIKQRENARKNKDFKLADKIRDELKEKNIVLEDTKQGVRWKKI